MWSAVEVNVGITCACIPTLKPLIIRILPATIIYSKRTRTKSDSQEAGVISSSVRSPRGKRASVLIRGENNIPQVLSAGQANDTGRAETFMTDFLTPSDWARPASQNQGHYDHYGYSLELTAIDLTTSDIHTPSQARQPHADVVSPHMHVTPSSTIHSNGVHRNSASFGLVKKPRNMLEASLSESLKYCTVVTMLFLLWGFTFGLLNTFGVTIASISGMSRSNTMC